MKKANLIVLVVLALSLVTNVILAVNYSSSAKKADAYAKKASEYTKKIADDKMKMKQMSAFLNSSPTTNVKIQPVSSYKYDRWETDGNVMTEDEASAIYEKYKPKYDNVGINGVQAPNPFGDKKINRALVTDKLVQKYLLLMINNSKERNRQRVDWLYGAANIDKSNLEHRNIYMGILKRWKDNYDFSNIASDKKKIEALD